MKNFPLLLSTILLPTFKVLVVVVFAASLSALNVPSTITLPLKVSTTKGPKSEAATEAAEVVPVPVKILVPALFAELSVIVTLSFGRINPSIEAAITAVAAACAAAFERLPAKSEAFAADIFELVLSSKVKIAPSRDAFTDFEKVIVLVATVVPVALSMIGTKREPVITVSPDAIADPLARDIVPFVATDCVTFVAVILP